MRRRSIVLSTGLALSLAVLAGCGDSAETPPPPPAAETADPFPGADMNPDTTSLAGPAAMDTPTVSPGAAPPASSPAPAQTASGPDPAQVAAGRQVYAGPGLCAACHGPNGQGTALGPNLTDGQWIWITEPGQNLQTQLVTIIRTGVAQPREHPAPMPPMGGANLSDEQLQAVAAYVISLN